MAKYQFWGTLRGKSENTVERAGSKRSGLTVEAAGWNGRIQVRVWHNETKGVDEFSVLLRPHWNGDGESKEIASGVLDTRALKDPYIPALIA